MVGQLSLLERLYGSIVVPRAVIDELEVGRQEGYDVPDCRVYGWMRPETVAVPAVLKLITNLGAGEAEALALALAQPADLVLLDDTLARQVAASRNIRYSGSQPYFGGSFTARQANLKTELLLDMPRDVRQRGMRWRPGYWEYRGANQGVWARLNRGLICPSQ